MWKLRPYVYTIRRLTIWFDAHRSQICETFIRRTVVFKLIFFRWNSFWNLQAIVRKCVIMSFECVNIFKTEKSPNSTKLKVDSVSSRVPLGVLMPSINVRCRKSWIKCRAIICFCKRNEMGSIQNWFGLIYDFSSASAQ